MTSAEILKQASRVVAGLIKEKTPPLFSTCRAAYKTLGEVVEYAAKAEKAYEEGVSKAFASAVDEVVKQLEVFRASLPDAPTVTKALPAIELATYLKDQVEKALAEEPARSLTRLHALKRAVEKASYDGTDVVTIETFVDPWQQATVAVDGDGKRVTSGAAGVAEVAGIPSMSIADVMKSAVASVEKHQREATTIDSGWPMDLTSREFLQGERGIFGFDTDKV